MSMADDRERALEAARRIVAAVNWTARGLHGDAQLVARALLAEAPAVPSLDWPKILQRYGAIHERISTYEDDETDCFPPSDWRRRIKSLPR